MHIKWFYKKKKYLNTKVNILLRIFYLLLKLIQKV